MQLARESTSQRMLGGKFPAGFSFRVSDTTNEAGDLAIFGGIGPEPYGDQILNFQRRL